MKNIPILRFPEFEELWNDNLFSDFYEFQTTNSYSRDNLNYENGTFKNIHYGDIHTKFRTQFNVKNENVPYINEDIDTSKINTNQILKEGDLVLADASEDYSDIGKSIEVINVDGQKVVAGLHTLHAKSKNRTYVGYGGFMMKFPSVRKSLMMIAQGTKVLGISSKRVSQIRINIPSLPEQQKIADFLTAVDKRIELLEKKKTLLETYKKGVMKKIFNQEIRFKDDNGNDFPEWEEKRLGDIGEFKTSSVDKKLDDNEQEVFLVNYMNVYRHETITNKNKHDLMVVTAKPNQIDSNNLLKGDILFTPSSETPDDIGHSVVIFEDLDDTLYSYHLLRFRPSIKIDILYSHYFCNNDLVLNQICRFATGSTRFTISKDSFSKILINLPCIEEQSKIARFLDSIDKQLELLETQIDKSKTWKKGLLQKMFV